MQLTNVRVEIHEKRNHPHEYGHYDATVGYTAMVEPGEDAEAAVAALRQLAHENVTAQCNTWIEAIRQERALAQARETLDYLTAQARRGWVMDEEDVEKLESSLAELPEAERAIRRELLDKAATEGAQRPRR